MGWKIGTGSGRVAAQCSGRTISCLAHPQEAEVLIVQKGVSPCFIAGVNRDFLQNVLTAQATVSNAMILISRARFGLIGEAGTLSGD